MGNAKKNYAVWVSLRLSFPSFFFLWAHLRHMEVLRLGVAWELQLLVYTSQPWQYPIRATSVTYTTVHGIARSLTHGAWPGIEPASSQTLCQVLSLLRHNRNSSLRLAVRGDLLTCDLEGESLL